MRWSHRCLFAALAITLPFSLLTSSGTGSAAVLSAPSSDGLSGTWQVNRICLTICASPQPVLKVVRQWKGAVFVTGGSPPQVLYRIGMQVVVHGPKDSSVLAIRRRGVLMSGSGVGADGSTFKATWHCVAAARSVAVLPGAAQMIAAFTKPAQAPTAMTLC